MQTDIQRELAKPLPTLNAAKFVRVPNRLHELVSRAQQSDALRDQVDRQAQVIDKLRQEKREVEEAQQRTAREVEALQGKSSQEIAQWVDLTVRVLSF